MLFPAQSAGQLYSLTVNEENVPVGLLGASQNRVAGFLATGSDSFDYLRSLSIEQNQYYDSSNPQNQEEFNTPQSLSEIDGVVFPKHWAALESLDIIICYDLTSMSWSKKQYEALVPLGSPKAGNSF